MNEMIYNPMREFDSKFKSLHAANTEKYLDDLVQRSGVDVWQNRQTVKEHDDLKEQLTKLQKKLRLWRFLRVLMVITLVLIPFVLLWINPKIKGLRNKIEKAEQRIKELMDLARRQMEPLNRLFNDRDALNIIEQTIPMLSFSHFFAVEQEANMMINFDFNDPNNIEHSTLDILSGQYNENPFVFENKLIHRMGTETYHGSRMISWTERYRTSDGKYATRVRTQVLTASVVKPKPYYSTQVVLSYCAQGGPELSFSRDATYLDSKSDKQIEKYIEKGEKRLKDLTDKAVKENRDFVSMANTDFEVLFDALNRTNEVQFRTLFTPLAQTNMVELIRSQTGYGDDFHFIKNNRTNKIISKHSQGRVLKLLAAEYYSHSFDAIRSNFIVKNAVFFKDVYFDFAPLWSIPMYQDRPVHSLQEIPNYAQKYSYRECEALSNVMNTQCVVHPQTKTRAILKSSFVASADGVDQICVTAYSYDIVPRVDVIPVRGGDGRVHGVPVPWSEYIPLQANTNFFVTTADRAANYNVLAYRHNLCIFN